LPSHTLRHTDIGQTPWLVLVPCADPYITHICSDLTGQVGLDTGLTPPHHTYHCPGLPLLYPGAMASPSNACDIWSSLNFTYLLPHYTRVVPRTPLHTWHSVIRDTHAPRMDVYLTGSHITRPHAPHAHLPTTPFCALLTGSAPLPLHHTPLPRFKQFTVGCVAFGGALHTCYLYLTRVHLLHPTHTHARFTHHHTGLCGCLTSYGRGCIYPPPAILARWRCLYTRISGSYYTHAAPHMRLNTHTATHTFYTHTTGHTLPFMDIHAHLHTTHTHGQTFCVARVPHTLIATHTTHTLPHTVGLHTLPLAHLLV